MKLFKNSKFVKTSLLAITSMSLLFTACGSNGNEGENGDGGAKSEISGSIEADGSSTVYPITEAIAEEFQIANPDTRVTVGMSGTGGGFKRFTVGETDISNASREIKDEEKAEAEKNGVEYTKFDVAYDGISVVVSKDNEFIEDITAEELKKIWEPNSTVKTWQDVRADWPAEPVKLYGPGTDSGTFDYFTEEIMGEGGASRTDYTASEDDNVLVQGIMADKNAMGYFGYAYYLENQDKLKVVSVNGIAPNNETIQSGEYAPLSRPIYIYVSNKSVKEKPQVRAFVETYLDIAKDIVGDVGYIALEDSAYEEGKATLEAIK